MVHSGLANEGESVSRTAGNPLSAADWNRAIRAAIRIANYRAIKHRDAAGRAVGDEQRGRAQSAEQACVDIADELTRQLKREKK